ARPLIFLCGKNVNWNRLEIFEDYLPFKTDVIIVPETAVLPVITAAGQLHPVMQIPGREISAWSLLPPVFISHKIRTPWPDTEILATARAASAGRAAAEEVWPLILVRSHGQKSAAVMGYELWRWHLMMAGIGNEDDVYHHFINNLIRWLQIEQRTDLIRLQTDRSIYHFGEPVRCTAHVYDAQLNPIPDAELRLLLSRDGERQEIDMISASDGRYTATLQPLTAGDYTLSLNVLQDGKETGRTQMQFSVGEYNQELNEINMQESLLRELARVSGGRFATIDSVAEMLTSIRGKNKILISRRTIEVWNRACTMIAIIVLLAAEWFVRKKKGMV
ncbi:hypothetical protein JXO59_06780, partial [candidate division KSB1 bacterium]|nr:hypothetical protein [candidate division KSB1 bacterium]